MVNIEKIKDYWMETMDCGEGRDWWENEVWSTDAGMEDLKQWYDAEVEAGLTEEELDRVVR